jgi:hypothetical protein
VGIITVNLLLKWNGIPFNTLPIFKTLSEIWELAEKEFLRTLFKQIKVRPNFIYKNQEFKLLLVPSSGESISTRLTSFLGQESEALVLIQLVFLTTILVSFWLH